VLIGLLRLSDRHRLAGMLRIAQQHMGVEPSERLTLFHMDGLDYLQHEHVQHVLQNGGYDVVILDVAIASQVLCCRTVPMLMQIPWS
jgi:hypothetical protein